MELTNELNERFKALYWGQRVGKKHGRTATWEVLFGTISTIDHLELRPISSITEEELEEFTGPLVTNQFNIIKPDLIYEISDFGKGSPHATDWLRSKSFLIDAFGIPSQQWLDWGVVKLKTE